MTKTIKKSVAFLSAAVMVMAMLLYFPSGTFSNIDWGLKASAVDMTQPSGDGSSGNPYQISTAAELYWFADHVNSGNTSANAVLTKDITVNTVNVENAVANCGGTKATDWIDWTPIGKSSEKYTGTFDGKGHKISGLYFNDTNEKTGLYVGLFGYVGPNGSVSNVGVVDSYFNGKSYVGGVCGWNYGYGGTATITNCYNSGTVEGTTYVGGVCGNNHAGSSGTAKITNCYNTGSVRGTENVGGVCGANYAKDGTATITNCYNTGTVTATAENEKVDANAGGVCGYNYAGSGGTATITNCYNTGTVSGESRVGGVCGQNSAESGGTATITNCYNTGTVSGESRVGGVCGQNSDSDNGKATITNCYNTGAVSGTGLYVGGVCGNNYAGSGGTATITNCYYLVGKATGGINGSDVPDSAESRTKAQFESGEVCGLVGYHSQFENGFCGLCDNGYQPATLLNNDNLNGISVNYIGYYAIENAGQLYWFAGLVNGTLDEVTQNASANAVLTANIIVNTGTDENAVANCEGIKADGWRDWTPIGNKDNRYTGKFDGQNHKISGLYFNDTSKETGCCVGLFGCVGIGGSVSNVGVVDSYFKGKDRVGGVCGFNINDSNGTATATITNCYNTGNVTGESNVGGVCGESRAFYNKCTATITNCYNTGNVSGSNDVGGVCGFNFAQNGTATITNCYNTGNVTGGSNVGGVCGGNHAASSGAKVTITNCYNTGAVSGNDKVGGVCEFNIANIETATATITDCYYLATEETDSIDGTTFKTSAQFGSGEVCYLLNNRTTDGSLVWYQTIDSETKDAYPLLDSNHGTVYASKPCPSKFFNTSNQPEDHTFAVDTENGKKHKCTKCGETHDAKFTVDNTTISICCDSSTITLKPPTQLTYDGKEKAATVEGKLTGIETPKILYKLKDSAEEAVETAPTKAGTYVASITYTIGGTNYSVSVEYTIGKATPGGDTNHNINVVCGVGTFTEPVFTGVDGKPLYGDVIYSGSKDYQQQVERLKTLSSGEGLCNYEFTPNDSNYNKVTGQINFIICDVEFKVGNDDATAANAVTVKENPTYGDTWEEILKLNEGLKAVISGTAVTGGFSLDVTGSPNAGLQTYKVLFNGTIGGNTYENLAVVSGTVDVKQKLLTVSAGDYKVTKVYNGSTSAGQGNGESLSITNIVSGDESGVSVTVSGIREYSGSDVSDEYTVEVTLSLTGDKSSNYQLASNTVTVPAEITKATQSASPATPVISKSDCCSVTLTAVEGYEYSKDGTTWQDSNVFTGLTAGTEYTFYQRIKATTNYEASASSTGVSQTTAAHNYTAKTRNSQTLYRYATCTLAAKYYYSCSVCGDVSKSSTFTYGSALGHNYTKQVISDSAKISDATCTSPAKYHYSCSRCNLVSKSSSYVFEHGDVKAHIYKEGGICSECNNLKNGKDGFKSVSVTLTDGVIINYFLLLSDTALADKNAYIHFTSAQGVNTKIKLSEGVKDSEGRYKFKLELLPDQMADEITAQVVYSDNTMGNSKAYSVKEYAAAVDNSGSAQAVKDLADAMLNFGAFTQLYTGENTDNLAADVKDYTENAVIGDEYKHKLTSNISDITVKGATLQIGAYTTIRVKYQLAAGAKIEDFTFKCGDTVLTPEKSGDYYYVYLRNIRPQNLDAMYSFTVSDKTGASATLDYSAFSYMKSILDNADKYDKKVVNLINAMYDYNKAAEAISSN